MRIRDTTIHPYPLKQGTVPAITIARYLYARHSDLNFEMDLQDYLVNGFVCSRPNVFGLAKVIEWEGEPAWFIRMAIGDTLSLREILPFPLKKIVFCRNNQKGVLRVYDLERVTRLVVQQKKHENRGTKTG